MAARRTEPTLQLPTRLSPKVTYKTSAKMFFLPFMQRAVSARAIKINYLKRGYNRFLQNVPPGSQTERSADETDEVERPLGCFIMCGRLEVTTVTECGPPEGGGA